MTSLRARVGSRTALRRLLLVASVGVVSSLAAASPAVDTEVEAVARVTASRSELRAGPGLAYRVVHRATRGDAFAIRGREPTGYWLRVYLRDGRTAYLLGDTADTTVLDATRASGSRPGFFAPPPLETARGGFSMSGGAFDGDGYAELKPALVLNPSLALEPYVGLVLGEAGRSLVYGGGVSVNLAPDWAVAPFLAMGGGGHTRVPNADAFALRRRHSFHARAGGGLLVSLRFRVTFRLEAFNAVIFDASSYRNAQSFSAGLGSYF